MDRNLFPTYDQMMQPTLEVLRMLGGEASIKEIFEHVVTHLDLIYDVAAYLHGETGTMTEVEYRLHWRALT
ncbi:MAG: hypothetical protein R3A44_41270 [Caldilineaceae bacterium]